MTEQEQALPPCNFVIFGATGNLATKKLIPALFHLELSGKLPEALTFRPGANTWQRHDAWPPTRGVSRRGLYFASGGRLVWTPPTEASGADRFVSDPAKPVPTTETIAPGMTIEYMVDDQRFAAFERA